MKKTIPVIALAALIGALSAVPPRGYNFLEAMDKDKNKEVTRAEWDAFHAERYKEMDANNDGKITKEESDKKRNEMRDKMRDDRPICKGQKCKQPVEMDDEKGEEE